LDICAVDDSRSAENLERLDASDPEERADALLDYVDRAHRNYCPISFWEYQDSYVEVLVEKIDLKSLFSPICAEFRVADANAKGWSDINGRAAMMARFARWEGQGKRCVLLYCGDHDPAGLNISRFLHDNLSELSGAVGWSPDSLVISRFGLNADFIERHELTWIDNLATSKGEYPLDDRRHPDHFKDYVQSYIRKFGVRKVEANALVVRPEAGRALCRDAILEYVDAARIPEWQAAVRAKQNELQRAIARLLAERQS
jgi:hypothetical protein